MAEPYDSEPANGTTHEEDTKPKPGHLNGGAETSQSLYSAFMALLSPVFFPDPHTNLASSSFFYRTKVSVKKNFPHLQQAFTGSGFRLLRWARQGSPLRLLLLVSVGSITLLTLTGVLVSLLFVAAATVNAIIISLFMSLAAAGGFLAIFFACLAVIYVGALSVAIFVIASATISAIITVLIVAGWIGFFWTIWLALRKSVCFAKRSVGVTGSALSAYTSSWHARRHNHHQD